MNAIIVLSIILFIKVSSSIIEHLTTLRYLLKHQLLENTTLQLVMPHNYNTSTFTETIFASDLA